MKSFTLSYCLGSDHKTAYNVQAVDAAEATQQLVDFYTSRNETPYLITVTDESKAQPRFA